MNDSDRREFESLRELSDQAWRSITERRNYEWKVVTVFWTAVAVAIAGSLNISSFPAVPGGRASVVAISFLLFLLFARWIAGLGKANNADRAIAIFYERKLQVLANAQFDRQVEAVLSAQRPGMGRMTNWAHSMQIGVTAVLATALVLLNWDRFNESHFRETQIVEKARAVLALKHDSLELARTALEVEALRADSVTRASRLAQDSVSRLQKQGRAQNGPPKLRH